MTAVRWFQLGAGALGLDSDDLQLTDRFDELFGDCAIAGPGALPHVVATVTTGQATVEITFEDPEPLDVPRFVTALFPDRGYGSSTTGTDAARLTLPEGAPVEVSTDGRRLRAPLGSAWRPLVANLAVNRALRLQREVIFFHAAALAVRGRGVLACGPKRSGKTTLALALASRGHGLLGEEMAGVRLSTRELLPVQRAVSVRQGPASAAARAALAQAAPQEELYPDGEPRYRAPIARLFSGPAGSPVALTDLILLRRFAPVPRVERALATAALLSQLTPLAASLWDRPPGVVTIQLLRLLSAVRIHWLDAGSPDETADLLEQLLEPT